jgi:hypothetical protein
MEIWKKTIESNFYSVSNYGRVKSNKREILRNNYRKQIINERILTPVINSTGYLKVRLNIEKGIQKNLKVHNLVAKAFLKKPKGKNIINHKNGIKTDNRLENLEWCTQKENIIHAWKNGLSNNNHCKKMIKWGDDIYPSINEAEKLLCINRNTISKSAENGYFVARNYEVIYNGVKYNSLKEAAKIVGLNPKTIEKRGTVIKPIQIKVSWITI